METFEKFIQADLDKTMTIKDVVEKLVNFHNVPTKNILDAFLNLRNIYEIDGATAVIYKTLQRGADVLGVRCYDSDKNWKSTSLIDNTSGQPLQHVS